MKVKDYDLWTEPEIIRALTSGKPEHQELVDEYFRLLAYYEENMRRPGQPNVCCGTLQFLAAKEAAANINSRFDLTEESFTKPGPDQKVIDLSIQGFDPPDGGLVYNA